MGEIFVSVDLNAPEVHRVSRIPTATPETCKRLEIDRDRGRGILGRAIELFGPPVNYADSDIGLVLN